MATRSSTLRLIEAAGERLAKDEDAQVLLDTAYDGLLALHKARPDVLSLDALELCWIECLRGHREMDPDLRARVRKETLRQLPIGCWHPDVPRPTSFEFALWVLNISNSIFIEYGKVVLENLTDEVELLDYVKEQCPHRAPELKGVDPYKLMETPLGRKFQKWRRRRRAHPRCSRPSFAIDVPSRDRDHAWRVKAGLASGPPPPQARQRRSTEPPGAAVEPDKWTRSFDATLSAPTPFPVTIRATGFFCASIF